MKGMLAVVAAASVAWASAGTNGAAKASGAKPSRPALVMVAAHPDDSEDCMGTFFLLREKYDLHIVDLTTGEGGLGEAGYRDGSTARIREKEEREACAFLGATPHFLGEVNWGDLPSAGRDTCRKLADLLRRIKPRAVFTQWPVDHHPDHVMCAVATMKAIELAGIRPELYFTCTGPWETTSFRPSVYVDVSSVVDLRTEFIRKYRCQNEHDVLPAGTLVYSSWRGRTEVEPQCAHAEAFAVFSHRPAGTPSVFDDLPKEK